MAVTLYRKAADQGLASAQYNLGVMYDRGRGLPQNYSAAVAWFRKAGDAYLQAAELTRGRGEQAERLWLAAGCYLRGQDAARAAPVLQRFLDMTAGTTDPKLLELRANAELFFS